MKKIFLSALILMVNFIAFSQDIAFMDRQDIRRSDENLNKEILTNRNDEDWPDCTEPEDIYYVLLGKDSIKITWDENKNLNGEVKYEVLYKDDIDDSFNKKIISTNYLILPNKIKIEDLNFKVRRICNSDGEIIKSEWVYLNLVESIVSNSSFCTRYNDTLNNTANNFYALYKINPSCIFFVWHMGFAHFTINKIYIYENGTPTEIYTWEEYMWWWQYDSLTYSYPLAEGQQIDSVVYFYYDNVGLEYNMWCRYKAMTIDEYGLPYDPDSINCNDIIFVDPDEPSDTIYNFCENGICTSLQLSNFNTSDPYIDVNSDNSLDVTWDGPIADEEEQINTVDSIITGSYFYLIKYTLDGTNWNILEHHSQTNEMHFDANQIDNLSLFQFSIAPAFHSESNNNCQCGWKTAVVNTIDEEGPKDKSKKCKPEDCSCNDMNEWNATEPIMNYTPLQGLNVQWNGPTSLGDTMTVEYVLSASLDGETWQEYNAGSSNSFTIPIDENTFIQYSDYITIYVYPQFTNNSSGQSCRCKPKRVIISNGSDGGDGSGGGGGNSDDNSLRLYKTYTLEDVDGNGVLGNVGDLVNYKFSVKNIGDNTVTGIVITDELTNFSGLEIAPSALSAGEIGTATASYEITQEDIERGFIENSATVLGKDSDDKEVTDISDAGDDNIESKDGLGNTDGDPTNDPTVVYLGEHEEELPDLFCGDAESESIFDNTDPLPDAFVGQIFKINKIPFQLTSLAEGSGNGIYSGEGIIAVPFKNKRVSVYFEGITVNTDKVVIDGKVIAKRDAGFTFSLNNTSSDIIVGCKKYDENSNGNNNTNGNNDDWKDGKYKKPPYDGWEEGDPYDPNYDPNGFDENGIHVITGKPYDENGCTAEGKNYFTGYDCKNDKGPYYWLDGGGDITKEGSEFVKEKKDSIRIYLEDRLNLLKIQVSDSINLLNQMASQKRDSMNNLLTLLKYPRALVFGIDDEYFAKGMHKKFKSTPKPYPINENRKPEAVELEKKHIQLYHLDKLISNYELKLNLINLFLTAAKIDERVSVYEYIIKRMDKEKIDELKNWGLKNWVYSKTDEYVNSSWKYNEDYYASIIIQKNRRWNKLYNDTDYYSSVASNNDGYYQSGISSDEDIQKRLQFEYEQGWSEMMGTSRAFYLQQIVRYRNNNLVPEGNGNTGELLPLTLYKSEGEHEYAIYLDNMEFYPTDAKLDAYFILDEPHRGKQIVFEAQNIHFNSGGLTDADSKLKLNSDINFPISDALGIRLIGSENKTYVEWDCDGFKELGIDMEVQVCRKYAIPLDQNKNLQDEPNVVKARITTVVDKWGEFIADVSIPGFVVTDYKDVKWSPTKIVFDFSSTENSSIMQFPENYNSDGSIGGQDLAGWEGFYISELSATLPTSFGKNNGDEVSALGLKNVIIDGNGFTGKVSVPNILPFEDNGDIGKWRASIDEFSLEIIKNKVTGGGLKGLINIPIFKNSPGNEYKKKDCFGYVAKIENNNRFVFNVTIPENGAKIKSPLWKTEIVLESSSHVEILYENEEFTNTATLNGTLEMKNVQLSEKLKIGIPKRRFTGLVIMNKAPYILGGVWEKGTKNEQEQEEEKTKLAGFPITISDIHGVRYDEPEIRGIGFDVNLNLTGNETGGIKAKSGLEIRGELKTSMYGFQYWTYKDFKVHDICIEGKLKGIDTLYGCIVFYESYTDPESDINYGTGFYGKVKVGLSFIKKAASSESKSSLTMSAAGQFGNVNGFRYFFVDILAEFDPGIKLGAIEIVGLGGGVSYHMKRDKVMPLPSSPPKEGQQQFPVVIGESLTHTTYIPDKETLFGVKAICLIALAENHKEFNANLSLEITFGGNELKNLYMKEISFVGTARFMKELDFGFLPGTGKGKLPMQTGMSANALIYYDFTNNVLHGDLEVYLVANSKNYTLMGSMSGGPGKPGAGKMVDAEFHFDSEKWYIIIGRADRSIGKRCGVALYKKGKTSPYMKLDAYFQLGTQIDDMPPLPDKVRGLLKLSRSPQLTGTGNGVAFGASVAIGDADSRFEWHSFYAKLYLELGFDVNLQDYGMTECANTGKRIGINGWYAMGQAYAYIEASVGITYKGNDYSIFDIAGAASLEARLPNPLWMRGAFGGRYSILWGLVSGTCNFQFELGERCIPLNYDTDINKKIIVGINPGDGANPVAVNKMPKVYFNYPVDKSVKIKDLNGIEKSYRISCTTKGVFQNETMEISDYQWSASKTELTIVPREILQPNTEYKVVVAAKLYIDGNEEADEDTVITFVTGNVLEEIPASNVEYAYPMAGQFNFYKNETDRGYIKLKREQKDLLSDSYGNDLSVELTSADGDIRTFDATYDEGDRQISFDIDGNALQSNTVYKLELKRMESYSPFGGKSGTSSSKPPKVIYTSYFRTSKYNTFLEKINYINEHNSGTNENDNKTLYFDIGIDEPFDNTELGKNLADAKSIRTVSNIKYSDWYKNGDGSEDSRGVRVIYLCGEMLDEIKKFRPQINETGKLFPGEEISIKALGEYEIDMITNKEFENNFKLFGNQYSYRFTDKVLGIINNDIELAQKAFIKQDRWGEEQTCADENANFNYPSYSNAVFKSKLKYYRPGNIYSSGGYIEFKK